MFNFLNVGTVPTWCILNVGTVPTFKGPLIQIDKVIWTFT